MSIRVIEALGLDPVTSQAIYHSVAESFTNDTPDTVLLVQPSAPYVCIGFHQDLDREIDVATCESLDLPIVRRQVGGGAVYLDSDQIFIQWVFRQKSLPPSISTRYALFAQPLIRTYQHLGIPATFRPVNDIHVNGRKIGGTGAASIGNAEVLVGSLMNDIDARAMSQVLRVSSEKMRDKLFTNISEYVTTIKRELGHKLSYATLRDTYLVALTETLGREPIPGQLTEDESLHLNDVRLRMSGASWMKAGGGRRVLGTKIHEGRYLYEGTHKAPGGLIRWIFVIADGQVVDCTLEGDFTIYPATAPTLIADAMVGETKDTIPAKLENVYPSLVADAPGITVADLVTAAKLAFNA
jgi:lipoate-protein ligase A